MKKQTFIIPVLICLLLFVFQTDAQYILTRQIDVRNDTLGNPNGSGTTNKHDCDTFWVYLESYYFGGENGNHTELLFRLNDTANCKGVMPSVAISWAYAMASDTLIYPNDDTSGYGMNPFRVIAESLKIFNQWIHFTLKDSIVGTAEALAFEVKTTYNDTAQTDSNRYSVYDIRFNSR